MPEPWKPERTWTVDEVRDIVRSRCDTVAGSSVKLIGTGWDNSAFLVDGEWIFRFARAAGLRFLCFNGSGMSCPCWHRALCPYRFRIRNGSDASTNGRFSGYRYMEGSPASIWSSIDDCVSNWPVRQAGFFVRCTFSPSRNSTSSPISWAASTSHKGGLAPRRCSTNAKGNSISQRCGEFSTKLIRRPVRRCCPTAISIRDSDC